MLPGLPRYADRCPLSATYDLFSVAPAELESVLLEHPDIVDVGVVGITSEAEATELPRQAIPFAAIEFASEATVQSVHRTRGTADAD